MKTGKLTFSAVVETAGAPTLSLGAAATHLAGRGAAEIGDEAAAKAHQAAAPQWVELLPAGTFRGRDGRGPFRLQEPAAVIAATQALGMGAGLPIDYDHATDFAAPEGRPAPAAGWIKALEVRGGAIWGCVEWTARAVSAIRAREYRYLSPVFQFDPADGRVTRLLRAGLTNNPNLYLTAIAAAELAAAPHEEGTMEEFLSRLKELLDLDPTAGFDEVLAAVSELVNARDEAAMDDAHARESAAANAGAVDPARFVGVADYQRALTELNALRAERARDRAALAVDEAMRAGKLSPAQREWAIAYCAADPRGFRAFAARQPSILSEDRSLAGEPHAQAGEVRAQLTATESAICAQLGVSSGEFLGRKNGQPDFLSLGRTAAEHDR